MSRLVVRGGSFARGPFRGGLGDDAPVERVEVTTADLTTINDRTKMILDRLDEDAKNRKFALMIAGASALFAAIKLGIIAFPHLRSRSGS